MNAEMDISKTSGDQQGVQVLDELVTMQLGFLFNLFTDIGYGNYLLTAPIERNKRQFWKADSEIPVEVEKIDVSDLLSLANTLTNPLAPSKKKKDKTEL